MAWQNISLQARSPSSAFLKVFVIPTPLNHGTHEEKTYAAFVLMMQDLPSWEQTYPTLGKRKVIFKKCLCNGICSFPGGWVVPCPVHQQSPPVSEESTSHGYTIAVQHCHGDGQVAVDLLLAALADVWFIYLHLGSSGQFKGNKSIKNTMP